MSRNSQEMTLLKKYLVEVLDGFGNKNLGRDGIGNNLRYDVPTTGHTASNILSDEENDESVKKRAACVLVISSDHKILAVSRRNDPSSFGLPGGKVDIGEDIAEAAARELAEETGLTAVNLKAIYTASDDNGYETTTFMGEVSGKIDTKEEGVIRWVTSDALINGPFSKYNKALLQRMGLVK